MFIKKIGLFLLVWALAACVGANNGDFGQWDERAEPTATAAAPQSLASGFEYGSPSDDAATWENSGHDPFSFPADGSDVNAAVSTVSVLLPLSGPDARLGQQIKHAVEIAFFQNQPRGVLVSFHDLSGNADKKIATIDAVLTRSPDMVIGPVFADDAKLIRDMKPDELPVLSFTSDAGALGRGVLSVGLMPNQSVETIIRQMAGEGYGRVLFLSPENQSGYVNASAAIESARAYGLEIAGLYYYKSGDTDSIKDTASRATLTQYRVAANTRAKETLSAILIKESLCPADKISLTRQLEKLNKQDALGDLPYDAVLFLGAATDSKTLASFLRYYDLNPRKVKFFGTALWDSKLLFNDITLAGSEYSSLPAGIAEFNRLYRDINGDEPERIASMGYDAAMLSLNTLQARNDIPRYLLSPSGYRGLDGLFKLHANGTNERALEVMELTGAGSPRLRVPAVRNFINPIYMTGVPRAQKPAEYDITSSINPNDYVTIPADLQSKYHLNTYGSKRDRGIAPTPSPAHPVMILPEDDADVFDDPDFQPVTADPVNRANIDEVELYQ
jgi:hypothetical protein